MRKSPAEKRWLLFLVSAYQFLVKAMVSIFFVTSLTIFLKNAGSKGMPYFYTAMNIVFITIQSYAARKLKGNSAGYLSISAWAFCVLAILRVTLPGADHLYLVTAFILSVAVYDLFFNQFFINFCNDIYPLQEGKANLPFISAFGSLGYIASGVILKLALSVVDIRTVMAANVGLIFVSQGVLVLVSRAAGLKESPTKSDKSSVESPTKSDKGPAKPGKKGKEVGQEAIPEGIGSLGKYLVLVFFFQMFGKYWLDYQYAKTINAAFSTEEELASFIAMFCACCDFLVLASLMGLTGRLLKKIRLSTALSFIPVTLFFLCIPVIFTSSFYLIVACQFSFVFLARALHNPSAGLIVAIMPSKRRIRTMSYAGMAASSGSLLVGLSLLLVQDVLTTEVAFSISLVMFLTTFIAVRYIDSAYQGELNRALDEGSQEGRLAAARTLATVSSYPERLHRLGEFLQGDRALKLEAVSLARTLRPEDVAKLLLPLFSQEDDLHVQASAASTLVKCGGPSVRRTLVEKLNDEQSDQRVRANIVEALGLVPEAQGLIKDILPLLSSDHHRVRANCAVTVIRLSQDERQVQQGLNTLWQMLDKKDEPLLRASALSALGRLQHFAFVPELTDSLRDSHEEVAQQALRALSQLPTPAVAELLHDYLDEKPPENLAQRTRTELNRIKRLNMEEVCQLLDAFSADERARVGNFLAGIEDDDEMSVVMQTLRLGDSSLRRAFTRFFKDVHDDKLYGRLRSCFKEEEDGSWFIDQDCLGQLVEETSLLTGDNLSKLMELLLEEVCIELYDSLILRLVKRLFVLQAANAKTKDERELLFEILAARSSEAKRAMEALDKVTSGDSFAASVGVEFLNSQLPNALAAEVVRYLQNFNDEEFCKKEALEILGKDKEEPADIDWPNIIGERMGIDNREE